MKRALVIGDSGGIGAAVRQELEDRIGADHVTGLSRSRDGLDVTQEVSITEHLGALPGHFDLIFVATGALAPPERSPEKSLSSLTPDALHAQFAVNTIGPALILKHAVGLLPRGQRSVFAALSARVGSIGDNGLGGWYSYRASKAALNQIVHTAAIEISRSRRQAICVALHPGTVATPFTRSYQNRHPTDPPELSAKRLIDVISALRPQDSGGFFDQHGKSVPW